ncbi:MAG: NERD domain-containing protein [Clostridium sp.]|nr:NERD domain-containing protein [Clostridium sp.]
MGLFNKMKEPVFLKESSDAQVQLEALKALEPLLNDAGKILIRQDIKNLEYGIAGEKNIAYELKNCHMPMYILHDIYIEYGDLSAQIDYLVFTRKICFVIECKNLYGNVEINSAGDFIRSIEYNGKWKKEGIYSPTTQNQRHLELMRKIVIDRRGNFLTKFATAKGFDDFYKSVVVLANPKTVLNMKYAKKEIKEKVIRADQLVQYIKERYNESKELADSDAEMQEWAQSFLVLNRQKETGYTEKYEAYRAGSLKGPAEKEAETVRQTEETCDADEKEKIEETAIFKELKAYRLKKSREEQIKPYFIYNNNQLIDLISKMPGTKEALKSVDGFGELKTEKYGEDILKIIEKHR